MADLNLHASCVVLAQAGRIFGASPDSGILLLGESGSGKSDLALRLLALGARLVADDRSLVEVADGALIARPAPALRGLLEVRGLGLVTLAYTAAARIDLAVVLGGEAARLPEPAFWPLPAGLSGARPPPLLRLNAFTASAPTRIILAAASLAPPPDRSPEAPQLKRI